MKLAGRRRAETVVFVLLLTTAVQVERDVAVARLAGPRTAARVPNGRPLRREKANREALEKTHNGRWLPADTSPRRRRTGRRTLSTARTSGGSGGYHPPVKK